MFIKRWLRPVLFTLAGVLAGLVYYYFIGCSNGICVITSTPWHAMAYLGLVGWLLSGVFGKECVGKCNM